MYTITGRIATSQTDITGKMKLTSAVDMLQDCSALWTESEPAFYSFLTENNLGMFLIYRQIDIVRLPLYSESVSATTSIYECKGFFGYRNTFMYDANGAPCVKTWALGAFVNRLTGKMLRVPQEVAAQVVLDERLDMEYLDRRIALPNVTFERLQPVPVRRNDIDFNLHMNNARYLEAALELVPEGLPISRCRIEYKAAAKPGDLLYPSIAAEGDKTFLMLSKEDGSPYTVMEFTE